MQDGVTPMVRLPSGTLLDLSEVVLVSKSTTTTMVKMQGMGELVHLPLQDHRALCEAMEAYHFEPKVKGANG